MATTNRPLTRCVVCETLFHGGSANAKYCSDNCRRIAARLSYDPAKNTARCRAWRERNAEYNRLFRRMRRRTYSARPADPVNLDRTVCSECGKHGQTVLFHYDARPGCVRALCRDCFHHLRSRHYNYRTQGYKAAYDAVKASSLALALDAMTRIDQEARR